MIQVLECSNVYMGTIIASGLRPAEWMLFRLLREKEIRERFA